MNDIAKDLCAFFRQESVLVTESTIQAYFVSEKPECDSERDSGDNKKFFAKKRKGMKNGIGRKPQSEKY